MGLFALIFGLLAAVGYFLLWLVSVILGLFGVSVAGLSGYLSRKKKRKELEKLKQETPEKERKQIKEEVRREILKEEYRAEILAELDSKTK